MKTGLMRNVHFRQPRKLILMAAVALFWMIGRLPAESGQDQMRGEDKPVLLISDRAGELDVLAAAMTSEGWTTSETTQKELLLSSLDLDLSKYLTVTVYVHQTFDPILEEALIEYAESGGKLLVLHHSLASAKTANSKWLDFLGVSILPDSKKSPWKVTAQTSHQMVNLAPGHYLTTHNVEYPEQVDFSFLGRPDLEGSFPSFTLEDTEVFHNQILSQKDQKVILFGYKTSLAADASGLPRMEPTSGWYKSTGKGWVFYFQAGHTEEDFKHPSFSRVLLNCLSWQPNNPRFASDQGLIKPEYLTIDLDRGESRTIELRDGTTVDIELKELRHEFDSYRRAVRKAEVNLEIDGREIVLGSGLYNLPRTIGEIQIDCPVTFAWIHQRGGSEFNPWSMEKEARFRIWPRKSAWIDPDSFKYPVEARWFSSDTQMTNDPCYVDHSDVKRKTDPAGTNIYYHYGLDVGGSEGNTVIRSAVDGLVLSSADQTLKDYLENTPVAPRYDVIYILDARGWIYRHSHFHSIHPKIKPGYRVKKGQELGKLGKEGGSGGWTHFHFDINRIQPSGRYGSEDGYAFYWQSYFTSHPSPLEAVARPHRLTLPGEEVVLDGGKSLSMLDPESPLEYSWILSDGSTTKGQKTIKKYNKPGFYNEILKVKDEQGNLDYDFCPVFVVDPSLEAEDQPHTIHAAYHPTMRIKAGQEITFKVRSFNIAPEDGREIWNFGDGSPFREVCSDGNAETHNPNGYAVTSHVYEKPGHYLVTVSRTSSRGFTATTHLEVRVGQP